MTAYTNKPTRLLKAIEDQVKFLVPTAVITHAFDGAGDEYLTINYSGDDHLVVIRPETAPASGATDGLGLTQRVYTPDVCFIGIDIGTGWADADTQFIQSIITSVCATKFTRLVWGYKANIAITELVDTDAAMKWSASLGAYDGFGYLGNQ